MGVQGGAGRPRQGRGGALEEQGEALDGGGLAGMQLVAGLVGRAEQGQQPRQGVQGAHSQGQRQEQGQGEKQGEEQGQGQGGGFVRPGLNKGVKGSTCFKQFPNKGFVIMPLCFLHGSPSGARDRWPSAGEDAWWSSSWPHGSKCHIFQIICKWF